MELILATRDGYVILGTALGLITGCQHLPAQPHLDKTRLLGQMGQTTSLTSMNNQPTRFASPPAATSAEPFDHALLDSISTPTPESVHKSAQITRLANRSGYYPLATGADAFAARSLLIHQARHSIDVQYYIWHDDETGRLMLQDLYRAANRGVQVRLLLDDMNTNPRIDQQLLAFAQHPNVAVRLMNPKLYRKFLPLNYVTHLPAINRRMHNKSMTFDGQVAIVGGRNIGDEYLRSDKATQFTDLDVMLAGKVVGDVGQSFQQYWDSPLAFDIETLVKPNPSLLNKPTLNAEFNPAFDNTNNSPEIAEKFPANVLSNHPAKHVTDFPKFAHKPHKIHSLSTNYYSSNSHDTTSDPLHLANTPLDIINDPDLALVDSHILANNIPFRWTTITFLADPVQKLINPAEKNPHLVNQLRHIIGKPQHEFTLISSYFVPTRDGVKQLTALVKSGVRVKILTNSFEATDVGAVHAGYSKSRKALLKAGVELYEYKSNAVPFYRPDNQVAFAPQDTPSVNKTTPHLHPYLNGQVQHQKAPKRPSLARTQATMSLHTKAFAVDNDKVFVGSYNIDPRSANINTELGVVIEDPLLASRIHTAVGLNLRNQAYQVLLSPQGDLQWVTLENSPVLNPNTVSNSNIIASNIIANNNPATGPQAPMVKISLAEPKMSLLNKILVKLFGYMPFNWML